MATQTMEAPALDEVEAAMQELAQLQEHVVALETELRTVQTRQGQCRAKDMQEFIQLGYRVGEIRIELPFARESITVAKIAVHDAGEAKAKRILGETQPDFEEAQREVVAAQQRLDVIGMKRRPHQMLLQTFASDKGVLNRQLDAQRAERLNQTALDSAPVVRSLQHLPRPVRA